MCFYIGQRCCDTASARLPISNTGTRITFYCISKCGPLQSSFIGKMTKTTHPSCNVSLDLENTYKERSCGDDYVEWGDCALEADQMTEIESLILLRPPQKTWG